MVMGLGVLHRRRPGRRDLLHGPPHRREDHAVPHRRPHRARRRLEPAQPARRHGAHRALLAVLFLAPGAQPRRRSRRCPGSSPSSALVEAGFGADEYLIVGVSLARQPADAVLDDEDLDRRVLEPGRRARPTAAARGRPCWRPAADGRPDRRCSSSSASASPSPPARCTRSASGPPPTCSTRRATSRRCSDDEASHPASVAALLVGLILVWVLLWGDASRRQRAQRRRRRRRVLARVPDDRRVRSARAAAVIRPVAVLRLVLYVARPARRVQRARRP